MAEVHASHAREIAAPAEQVYGYIRDFRNHRARFLPPAFSEFQVTEGGLGAGTEFAVRLTTPRRSRVVHMRVAEPAPGSVLTEADTGSSLVTTWTVTPRGSGCTARIDTRWNGAKGFGGLMERLFAPPALRKIYAEELDLLDAYARRGGG